MLIKFLSSCFLCVLLQTSLSAQSLYLKFKDNTEASYPLKELRNISFDGDVMIIKRTNGNTASWNISNIRLYRYDQVTSINEPETLIHAEVKIFPNPFRDAVRIRYKLPVAEKVGIEIFDLQGKIVRVWQPEKKIAGTHELLWQSDDANGNRVSAGTYICRIKTPKGSVTKLMIME